MPKIILRKDFVKHSGKVIKAGTEVEVSNALAKQLNFEPIKIKKHGDNRSS